MNEDLALSRLQRSPAPAGRRKWLLLLLALCLPSLAFAADALYCPVTGTPPVIDGALDEAAWTGAAIRYPVRLNDLPPMFPASVRLLWDDEAVYVGFECLDQDVRSTLTERDSHIWEEGDLVEMFLFTLEEKPRRIELELNPNNAFLDILHEPGKSFEEMKAWNWEGAQWAAKVYGTLNRADADTGWTAELKLPWRGLRSLGLADGARAGLDLPVLFLLVNRNELAEGRMAREQTLWPNLEKMRVTKIEEFGRLVLVPPRGPEWPVEGFARVVKGHSRRNDPLLPDYRGQSVPWEFGSDMDDAVLVWETAPLPARLDGPARIAFVGQTAADGGPDKPERAFFQLLADGRPILRFAPFQQADMTWAEGGARLEFAHRGGKWLPSGLFTLTLPADAVRPGRPVRLEVKSAGGGPRTRFMLKAWTDAVLFEHSPFRERNP